MLDIKSWLEQCGEDVADTAFVDAHSYPFVVFIDYQDHGGSDLHNDLTRHDLTVERYSEDGEESQKLKTLIVDKAVHYEYSKQWLSDVQCFEEIYEFELIERI